MLRVWRSVKDDNGVPMTNDEGDPLFEVVELDEVVMCDNRPVMLADGGFETKKTEWLCFGYRTQGKNTKDTVDVMVSDYKLATPMFVTPLSPGDRIEIRDYDREYWGEVVRKQTFNLGSNIWINEVMN
jgi:hypothetical protein